MASAGSDASSSASGAARAVVLAHQSSKEGACRGALLARKALRPDLDVTRATDILWTLNHPDLWQLLVAQRAWTPEQYEQWFGDTACAQLLSATARGSA
ncbi:hypothetical protein BH20ACT17_BH20ACT17_05700 [soil metagenome]